MSGVGRYVKCNAPPGRGGELAELLLLLPLEGEEEELLLQAAAARHTASDADATTAPFLTIRII